VDNLSDLKKKDVELWKTWKKQPTPQNLMHVVNQLNPVIQAEVNRWSGAIARPTLELQAKNLAIEAIESYKPTGGAALNTHVTNRLKKLSRIVYENQNLARIPEYKTQMLHTYNTAESALQDQLGRAPTAEELRDELNWTKNFFGTFRRSLRKELTESKDVSHVFDLASEDSGLLDFAYHDLSPIQQKIFEYKTGYGGAEILPASGIMKKLKLKQSQLSYQQSKMVDHLNKVMTPGLK
jgi:DNA-directed RNA polymerase specialized sigma subunit